VISPADLNDLDEERLVKVVPIRTDQSGWMGWVRPANEWPELIDGGFYDFDYYLEHINGTRVAFWDDDLIERIAA